MVSLTSPLVLETTEVHLTDEQFYQFCRSNPDLTIERSAKGALIVMSPVGGEGGSYESEFGIDLASGIISPNWAKPSAHPPCSNYPMEAIALQMPHG